MAPLLFNNFSCFAINFRYCTPALDTWNDQWKSVDIRYQCYPFIFFVERSYQPWIYAPAFLQRCTPAKPKVFFFTLFWHRIWRSGTTRNSKLVLDSRRKTWRSSKRFRETITSATSRNWSPSRWKHFFCSLFSESDVFDAAYLLMHICTCWVMCCSSNT